MERTVEDRPLILVIEDDASVRSMLEAVLGSDGFDVRTAEDGLEGLVKARMLGPRLLVLDLRMPDVDGLRMLEELHAEHVEVPVLVLTGDDDAAQVARERLGDDAVLVKPVEPALLAARIHAMIGTRRAEGSHDEA